MILFIQLVYNYTGTCRGRTYIVNRYFLSSSSNSMDNHESCDITNLSRFHFRINSNNNVCNNVRETYSYLCVIFRCCVSLSLSLSLLYRFMSTTAINYRSLHFNQTRYFVWHPLPMISRTRVIVIVLSRTNAGTCDESYCRFIGFT